MSAVTQGRLLFVCPTSSPIGGLQTWLDELCRGLANRGWDPVVALVHGPSTHDSVGYKAAHPDLQTVVIDGTAMTMGARVREVMRTIRRLNPDYYVPLTVIDAHDAVCHLKQSGARHLKYVLSVHGNMPQQLADARLFQAFADVSINPGALTCRMVEWAGMPASQIFHVPNGIAPRDVVDRPLTLDTALRLAYVGRLTDEDKRVMDLVPLTHALEAAGISYHLDIVGSGPCEQRLKELISTSSVTFHGFVESELLHREYYPRWDVLLMFSQSEAFGLSLIEAMVHGVVPISSQFMGSRSEGFLIDRETARLFPIGDTTECARIIGELAAGRGDLARMSCKSQSFVTSTYSWNRCVEEWEAALIRSREFVPRPLPAEPPRPIDEGHSLASRFPWLPRVCSDQFYKTKRRLLGIPEAIRHGEEWPFHTGRWSARDLEEITAVTTEMDLRCAG
jgi:glycosyltransferase involved in cell wall biosynthesis